MGKSRQRRKGVYKDRWVREKYCTACKRMHPITEFSTTSRKHINSAGLEEVYHYHHAKCRMIRRHEQRLKRCYKKINERNKRLAN